MFTLHVKCICCYNNNNNNTKFIKRHNAIRWLQRHSQEVHSNEGVHNTNKKNLFKCQTNFFKMTNRALWAKVIFKKLYKHTSRVFFTNCTAWNCWSHYRLQKQTTLQSYPKFTQVSGKLIQKLKKYPWRPMNELCYIGWMHFWSK